MSRQLPMRRPNTTIEIGIYIDLPWTCVAVASTARLSGHRQTRRPRLRPLVAVTCLLVVPRSDVKTRGAGLSFNFFLSTLSAVCRIYLRSGQIKISEQLAFLKLTRWADERLSVGTIRLLGERNRPNRVKSTGTRAFMFDVRVSGSGRNTSEWRRHVKPLASWPLASWPLAS